MGTPTRRVSSGYFFPAVVIILLRSSQDFESCFLTHVASSSCAEQIRDSGTRVVAGHAMSTKSLGSRAADAVFKTFTGALFVTTVVTGGWFAATSISAASHYDRLEKLQKAKDVALAEEKRLTQARAAERAGKRWRVFG